MNASIRLLTISLLLATGPLFAQETLEESPQENPLLAASELRATLAAGIDDDRASALKALAKLRSANNPSGLPMDGDADLGIAAIDVGHRLLVTGKPTAAAEFFKAAEQALDQAVQRTSNDEAHDKAQYLQHLALVRRSYLGKKQEADDNLEAALALQPEDQHLQRLKRTLSARDAAQHQALTNSSGSEEASK